MINSKQSSKIIDPGLASTEMAITAAVKTSKWMIHWIDEHGQVQYIYKPMDIAEQSLLTHINQAVMTRSLMGKPVADRK